MSNTATFGLARPSTFLGRLIFKFDRLLLTYAEAMIRNGDVPRCGV